MLKPYRPADAYATQLITMHDLYPGKNWNFCFGWASFTEGVAAFSFCRYDPDWDGIDDPDRDQNLLMRGCAILCHEICHQFGLKHCIYYECLMNGIMSAEEQRDGGIRILCPVCQKKLKQNLRFDSQVRFEGLLDVCEELGFDDEAAVYRKLLDDVCKSGLVPEGQAAAAMRRANHGVPPVPDILFKGKSAIRSGSDFRDRQRKTVHLVGKNGPNTPRSDRTRSTSTSSVSRKTKEVTAKAAQTYEEIKAELMPNLARVPSV